MYCVTLQFFLYQKRLVIYGEPIVEGLERLRCVQGVQKKEEWYVQVTAVEH